MATFISRGPEDTAALGEQWGRAAQPGWVIGLSGELGAGKTQLVRGLARGLGCPGRVHSPTFALVNTYDGGRLTLVHLDLYRLESPHQIVAAGLEEILADPAGVTVIEWAERWWDQDDLNAERGVRNAGPGRHGANAECNRDEANADVRPPSDAGRHRAAGPGRFWRRVLIETLSQTERRIVYEDFGA